MKLTIEPTTSNSDHAKITIELRGDHHDLGTVIDDIVKPALIGWGFGPALIDEWFAS